MVERDAARKGGGSPTGLTPQVVCLNLTAACPESFLSSAPSWQAISPVISLHHVDDEP